MGKGDKKTKRGKIFMGSYGNSRPSKPSKPQVVNEETKTTAKKK
jgi:30S ribosomal protein S31